MRPGGRFDAWRPGAPRMVLSDMDGTLLGSSHLPTLPVGQAVGAARAAGLRVGVATGREWSGVARVAGALDLDGPHVLLNGAEVRDGTGVLERWPLPPGLARRLVELCLSRGWYAEFYAGDGFVVTDVRAPARQHWDLLQATPYGTTDDLDLDRDAVAKATVIVFDPAELPGTVAALEAAGANPGVGFAPLTPSLRYVNVTRPDVDKGRALACAAEVAGVGLAEVAVLGDGFNDLPLLAPAGTAVAMGQAPPEVRAAAHLVAPSVAEDGAATALLALADLARRAELP
jgi:Cof subfamily protein (haloacid dehalogenase superfamily)